jgi:hypothetical protein
MRRCHTVLSVLTDIPIIDAATDNCCDYRHYAVKFCATCRNGAVSRNAITFKMNVGTRDTMRRQHLTFTVQTFGNNSDEHCDEGRWGNSSLTGGSSIVKRWNETWQTQYRIAYSRQDLGHATVLLGTTSSHTHEPVIGYGAIYREIGFDSRQYSLHTGYGNGNYGITLI